MHRSLTHYIYLFFLWITGFFFSRFEYIRQFLSHVRPKCTTVQFYAHDVLIPQREESGRCRVRLPVDVWGVADPVRVSP